MRMELGQKELLKALKEPLKAAGKHGNLILGPSAMVTGLAITGRMGDGPEMIQVTKSMDCCYVGKIPMVEVGGKEFAGAVKAAGRGDLWLEILGSSSEIVVKSKDGFEQKLCALAHDPRLNPPPTDSGIYPVDAASRPSNLPLLLSTAASDRDESRAVMTGISFQEVFGEMSACATDGRRASVVKLDRAFPEADGLTIPAAAFGLIPKGEHFNIYRGEPNKIWPLRKEELAWFIRGSSVEVSGNGIEGRFPDLNKVIPSTWQTTLSVNRKALLAAVDRLLLVSKTNKRSPFLGTFAIATDGIISMSSHDPSTSARVDLTLKTKEFDGEELYIGLNLSYIKYFLKGVETESVCIEFRGPDKGVLFCPEDRSAIHVIMPVKLRK